MDRVGGSLDQHIGRQIVKDSLFEHASGLRPFIVSDNRPFEWREVKKVRRRQSCLVIGIEDTPGSHIPGRHAYWLCGRFATE
jgi:hypothetical protein